MPFFQRTNDDGDELIRHPHSCRCSSFDYSRVDEGQIRCRDCGRVWRLRGRQGWWPYPCPGCNMNPEHCRHYGKRPWSGKKE